MTQPQVVDGRVIEPTHHASASEASASVAPAACWKPVVAMSTNQGLRGEGRGKDDVDVSTADHSSSRSDSTDDADVEVDIDGIGDESSTVSGTSVAEEGWESGHGPDNEEAAGLGLEAVEKGEGGGALPAAVRKRNSFRRAFDKARWVLVLATTVMIHLAVYVGRVSVRRSHLSFDRDEFFFATMPDFCSFRFSSPQEGTTVSCMRSGDIRSLRRDRSITRRLQR